MRNRYKLFISRIDGGLYSRKHDRYRYVCTAISVSVILYIFFVLFGSPIRNKNSKNSYETYSDGENICRNRISIKLTSSKRLKYL